MKTKIVSLIIILFISTSAFAEYDKLVPSAKDSALYYNVGGGNVVPTTPSNKQSIVIGFNNLGALGYNCGRFNGGASILKLC